jgi:hypothetical protein
VRYHRTFNWYNYVLSSYPNYLYANWIFYPAPTGYNNGYYVINNYPYYVYNGYQYRYSSQDYCNYQLVDSYDHRVQQTYWNQICNSGYDTCSVERDRLNSQMGEYRYFCSETYRDQGYDYSQPTYEQGGYDTTQPTDVNPQDTYVNCQDNDNDGYCDPGTIVDGPVTSELAI